MAGRPVHPALLLLVALFSTFASIHGTKTYIVYMGHKPESVHPDVLTSSHHELLATVLQSLDAAKESLLYSYNQSMNGFAAVLEPEHAAYIAGMPGVVSVFESRTLEPQTTNSMAFLGLEDQYGNVGSDSMWTSTNYGKDIIIGIVDTGIWPESASFNDDSLGPIPSRWKGTCETAGTFSAANCNKKIIGARYFSRGVPLSPRDENSPRDMQGHGTHVASTAAGSFVPDANMLGFAKGTAKGVAPQARIAVYKVCWIKALCNEASILAAIDQAIKDGVDVINLSLGGKIPPSYDMLADTHAVGALHAILRGVHVISAGGNDGPLPETIKNIAPWIITVAASSIDREFHSELVLGNNQVFKGRSLSVDKLSQRYPLVIGKNIPSSGNTTASEQCAPGSLQPSSVNGKIVVCEASGETEFPDKAKVVKQAGGVGMIIINNVPGAELLLAFKYTLPAIHVGYSAGTKVVAYIKSSSNPVGYIKYPDTVLGYKPAPVMGLFSSVGPSLIRDVIKPDITAPGVDILAAWSAANSSNSYEVVSGTSMASPHVAGVAALLKSLHPDWSPAAVKSAIMTTAYATDNNGNTIRDGLSINPGGPFNYGSGHISPKAAADPGLVYNTSLPDYADFLCSLGYTASRVYQVLGFSPSTCRKGSSNTLNYPSVAVPDLKGSITISRTVTNVGQSAATYKFFSNKPAGVSISASPSVLQFSKYGESQTFSLTLKVNQASTGYVFGDFSWSDGRHVVRSPIAVQATSTVNSELMMVV